MNRPLARIFLRWVEHFVEIRRQLAVIRKVVMRVMKQNIARAFYQWSSNVGEDVRIKIIFTKVLLRWTRHGLKVLSVLTCVRMHAAQRAPYMNRYRCPFGLPCLIQLTSCTCPDGLLQVAFGGRARSSKHADLVQDCHALVKHDYLLSLHDLA